MQGLDAPSIRMSHVMDLWFHVPFHVHVRMFRMWYEAMVESPNTVVVKIIHTLVDFGYLLLLW